MVLIIEVLCLFQIDVWISIFGVSDSNKPCVSVNVRLQWPKQLNAPLEEVDPEIADIIEHEKARQWKVY